MLGRLKPVIFMFRFLFVDIQRYFLKLKNMFFFPELKIIPDIYKNKKPIDDQKYKSIFNSISINNLPYENINVKINK